MANKVRVAIVGLGFGAEFIPIYQAHPDAQMYAICQRNEANLKQVGVPPSPVCDDAANAMIWSPTRMSTRSTSTHPSRITRG